MECSECEVVLEGEEAQSPKYRTGETGDTDDVLCDECYDGADLEFECCLCCNYEHTAYQDRIGDSIIVGEPTPGGYGDTVEPGVYRITKHPYYGGPLIGPGAHLVSTAIARVADVPKKVFLDDYPVGHCCRGCVAAAKTSARKEI